MAYIDHHTAMVENNAEIEKKIFSHGKHIKEQINAIKRLEEALEKSKKTVYGLWADKRNAQDAAVAEGNLKPVAWFVNSINYRGSQMYIFCGEKPPTDADFPNGTFKCAICFYTPVPIYDLSSIQVTFESQGHQRNTSYNIDDDFWGKEYRPYQINGSCMWNSKNSQCSKYSDGIVRYRTATYKVKAGLGMTTGNKHEIDFYNDNLTEPLTRHSDCMALTRMTGWYYIDRETLKLEPEPEPEPEPELKNPTKATK